MLPIQGPPGSGKTYTGARMIVAPGAAGQARRRRRQQPQGHRQGARRGRHRARAEAARHRPHRPEAQDRPARRRTRPPSVLRGERGRRARRCGPHAVDVVGGRRVDVVPPGDGAPGARARRARRRRGRPDEPRQRPRVCAGGTHGRAARRPAAARPADPGRPPAGRGAQRAVAPARRPAYVHPDRPTITPAEGLFLDQTWRLHPDICDFTSEAFYAGRLRPVEGLERQLIVRRRRCRTAAGPLSGTGLRYLPVPHAGNATDSAGGGGGDRGARRGPARRRARTGSTATGVEHALTRGRHRHRRARTTPTSGRSNARCADDRPAAGLRGHRGQVPGPGGARSASTRWARPRPRTRRGAWSSCTRSTASTSRRRAPAASRRS